MFNERKNDVKTDLWDGCALEDRQSGPGWKYRQLVAGATASQLLDLLRVNWYTGRAHSLKGDNPPERQRWLAI